MITEQSLPKVARKTSKVAGKRNRRAGCVYAAADGSLSYRNVLQARECSAIDRALSILESAMRRSDVAMPDPDAVKQYLALAIGGCAQEQFGVMYLNSQHHLIEFEVMFVGTLTQTSVYPREIASAALLHGASAVVLAHNHPSGNLNPSAADDVLTMRLKTALQLVDVRVLDHVIVSGSQAFSMAAAGLL